MLALIAAAAALAAPTAAPPPSASLPAGAAPIAQQLATTTQSLHTAVDLWRTSESPRPPRQLLLWALHQQRLYLSLGLAPPGLGDAVVRRLPRQLQANARDVLTARRALVRLTPPTTQPLSAFRTGPADPADRLLGYYREAQRRFGVPWHVLAAVNFIETAFGKVRSPSTAGAQGPMQFLPATWRAYGLGGDIYDPRDVHPRSRQLPPRLRCARESPTRALLLQPLEALRGRRPRVLPRHAPRAARVLRFPRLAGVRANSERLSADHEPVAERIAPCWSGGFRSGSDGTRTPAVGLQ